MLQTQNGMQTLELNNQTRRNQELYDQYTRIDIQCNRVSEDLLLATSQIEQLRNEAANLRAEKKIWEVRFRVHSCSSCRLNRSVL